MGWTSSFLEIAETWRADAFEMTCRGSFWQRATSPTSLNGCTCAFEEPKPEYPKVLFSWPCSFCQPSSHGQCRFGRVRGGKILHLIYFSINVPKYIIHMNNVVFCMASANPNTYIHGQNINTYTNSFYSFLCPIGRIRIPRRWLYGRRRLSRRRWRLSGPRLSGRWRRLVWHLSSVGWQTNR